MIVDHDASAREYSAPRILAAGWLATRERAGPRQPIVPRVGAFALATVARRVNGVFGGQHPAVPMLWQ